MTPSQPRNLSMMFPFSASLEFDQPHLLLHPIIHNPPARAAIKRTRQDALGDDKDDGGTASSPPAKRQCRKDGGQIVTELMKKNGGMNLCRGWRADSMGLSRDDPDFDTAIAVDYGAVASAAAMRKTLGMATLPATKDPLAIVNLAHAYMELSGTTPKMRTIAS